VKPFGLRVSRIKEFLLCVRTEKPGGVKAYRKLLRGALTVIFRRNDMPLPGTAHKRLRTCLKCPHRDGGHWLLKFRNTSIYRDLKRNRPNHLPLRCGKCGCYIPYLISSTPPITPCPARDEDPTKGWE
jgi:hypothetical protein